MALLEIRLFGTLQVILEGEPVADLRSEKALALLAYLAVESDRAHRREKLAGLLWPDFTEASARMNLSRALADLRSAIERKSPDAPLFHATKQSIQFAPNGDVWVDVSIFNHLLKSEPPSPMPGKQPDTKISQLEEAVTLYCGPFLESFSLPDSREFEEWLLLIRERLTRRAIDALYGLAVEYERDSQLDQALNHLYQLLELDPWQEKARYQLMRLLALDGRRDKALAEYEKYRQELARELGAEPSARTQQLYEDLLEGIWLPDGQSRPEASGPMRGVIAVSPYRGLSAFREQHARFFCGRERFSIVLRQAVEQRRFNAVIGSSGSGKSSVVFAGLIPDLTEDESGEWLTASCRLGGYPVQSLAKTIGSLQPANKSNQFAVEEWIEDPARFLEAVEEVLDQIPQKDQLLLVIDQFEELYTHCPDPGQRNQFLDLLLNCVGADSRLKILITLRADFMGQALAYRPFADVLQDGSLMLGPMSREELRAAIARPAEIQGTQFEPGLVDRILHDVGDEPGNLPLLEFALTLLWEQGGNGLLKHEAYDQLGGVEGALARYAEQVYANLRPEDQDRMPKIMMQLVRPGLGTDDTRRVATWSEIGEENWALTRQLADERLAVTGVDVNGNETVELAHEVLIWEWDRLQAWLNEHRSFRVWQERLRTFVSMWEAAGRDENIHLRGVQLAEAEDWLEKRGDALSPSEWEFIRNSLEINEQREAEKKAQQQDRQAAAKRTRRLSVILAGVFAIAAFLTVFLAYYYPQQRRQAQEAYSLSLAANARDVLNDRDTSMSLALALAANQIADPPDEAQRILMEAAYAPGARWREIGWSVFKDVKLLGTTLEFSPDGRTAITGFPEGQIIQWDIETQQELNSVNGSWSNINEIAVSPDGSLVLSGNSTGYVFLWNLAAGKEIRQFEWHTGPVNAVDISADGKMGVSAGLGSDETGEIILWDLTTGEEIRQLQGLKAGVLAAKFVKGSSQLLTASGEDDPCSLYGIGRDIGNEQGDLTLWDTASGEVVWMKSRDISIVTLDVGPDGTQALTGSCNGDVVLWDLDTGNRLRAFDGHLGPVYAVSFTPDGLKAVSGSWDQSMILWDLANEDKLAHIKVHDDSVVDLAVSPDGRSALSVSEDGTMILLDLVDASIEQQFEGFGDTVYDVAPFSDGENALSIYGSDIYGGSGETTSIILWSLATGSAIRSDEISPGGVIDQFAVSPDEQLALLAGTSPDILIWDIQNWKMIGSLEGHTDRVTDIAFLPDGRRAFSMSQDGRMILWNVLTKTILYQLPGKSLWALAISPDGKTAVTNSGDKNDNFLLWDLENGKIMDRFDRSWFFDEHGSTALAYLPDGRSVLSCDSDGAVIEWDLEEGNATQYLGFHDGICTRIAVSPDASLAVTSSADGRIMIWDLRGGKLIRRYDAHSPILSITLSHDGQYLYFGALHGVITQMRIDNPSLEETLSWIEENRYIPALTCKEREKYHVEPICDG